MKKILTICIMVFAVACSSDSAEIQNGSLPENVKSNEQAKYLNGDETPPIIDEIDELFYAYVNSDEYLNVNAAVAEFSAGLSNFSAFPSFTSEEMMLNWIGENLIHTNFTSIAEAQSKWNEVNFTATQLNNRFPAMWEFITSTTVIELAVRFDKWLPIYNSHTNSAYCHNKLKSCRKEASDAYASSVMVLAENYQNGEMSGSQKDYQLRTIKVTFDESMKTCLNDFNSCTNP